MTTTDPAPADQWLTALRTSQRQLAGIATRMSDSDVQSPSYADEWSVAQVLSHLGSGAEIFTICLDAGLAGEPAPAPEKFQAIWKVWDAKSPSQQARDGLLADATFVDRVEALDAEQAGDWSLEMMGSTQRLADLLRFRLGEHAVHTWDIEVSRDPRATVGQPAVDLLIDTLAQTVGRAGKAPTDPLRVRVSTSEPIRRFRLHSSDDKVSLDAAAEPPSPADHASVDLPAEALLRLVYGRLDPDHTPGLETEGIDIDTLRATFPGV